MATPLSPEMLIEAALDDIVATVWPDTGCYQHFLDSDAYDWPWYSVGEDRGAGIYSDDCID